MKSAFIFLTLTHLAVQLVMRTPSRSLSEQLLGAPQPCPEADKHRMVQEALNSLQQNDITLQQDPSSYVVTGCTIQLVNGALCRVTIESEGQTCSLEILTHFLSPEVTLMNPDEALKACPHLFTASFKANQLPALPPVLGGREPCLNPTKTIARIFTELNRKYLTSSVHSDQYKVVSCYEQVISGLITDFTVKLDGKDCRIKVYEGLSGELQFAADFSPDHDCPDVFTNQWAEDREIEDNWHEGHGLVGGYQQCSDPAGVAAHVLVKLSDQGLCASISEDEYKVLGCQQQVVNGLNTDMSLEINGQKCHLKVYESLEGNIELREEYDAHLRCRELFGGTPRPGNQLRKHLGVMLGAGEPEEISHLPGGLQTCSDPDATVDEVLTLLNQQNLSSRPIPETYKVLECHEQVVAGKNVEFTIDIDGQSCHVMLYENQFGMISLDKEYDSKEECPWLFGTWDEFYGPKGMLVGGFNNCEDPHQVVDRVMRKLEEAKVGMKEGVKEYDILECQQQVVSGLNIKFAIKVNGKVCRMEVYEDLQQVVHLNEGFKKEVECAELFEQVKKALV